MNMTQTLLHLVLSRWVRTGTLTVRYPSDTHKQYGSGGKPHAGLDIKTSRAARRLLTNPALALGECYMDGEIEPLACTLHELLDLILTNCRASEHPIERWTEKLRWIMRRLDQFNTLSRSQRNVAHHYDLDGRLYSLLLDPDMQYSCAYFPRGNESLAQAQRLKKRHIAAKLHFVREGLEVLDIGCGWGGMALYLARHHGAKVVGLTLSSEQLLVARERARQEGLQHRVRFELLDYREWKQPVDRIVSVGMFEHVGVNHHTSFFRGVRDNLKEDGVALIHAIGQSNVPTSTNPWIAKYIFPGGYSPAISEVFSAVEKSGLWATDLEVLRLHYAQTLGHWRTNLQRHRRELQLLYDDRFVRMFEFYLSGSELSFRHLRLINWQLQLTRSVDTLPLARDYMFDGDRPAATRHQASSDVERDDWLPLPMPRESPHEAQRSASL